MQLPEKVNFNWRSVLQQALLDNTINIHEITSENSEIAAELKNANASYEYWDKVKYTVLPEDISSELFWSVLKFRRSGLYAGKVKLGINTFKYLINPEILKKFAFIENFNLKTYLSLDEQNQYCANAKMEEAAAACRLEGADVAVTEAKEMLRSGRNPENENEKAVVNNFKALNFIEKTLVEELSPELIRQIYSVMTSGSPENYEKALFRGDDCDIRVVDIKDDAVLYQAPKASDIEGLLASLCEYANQEEDAGNIIKAINIHFLFSYIHPFEKGSGTLARILFYRHALKSGYDSFRYLSVSKVLRAVPSQYVKSFLYVEMDENDLTYFINFNLDVILEAIAGFKNYLESKSAELSDACVLTDSGIKLNLRQQNIIKDFVKNGVSRNIEYFKNKMGIVYETARTDLMYLAKKGLLSKNKKGKEFLYSLSKKALKKMEENKPA